MAKTKTVWMYYQTDGDSGFYAIKLFSTKQKADDFYKKNGSAYGAISEIVVN